MFTSDNFVREGMRDVDIEAGEAQRDLDCLRFSGDDYNGSGNEGVCTLPPLLFTPASPVAERGRGFDHAISRGNTRPRAFSHSPQPTHIRHPDTLHRSSDAASISQTSALYGGYAGAYGTPPQDDIDFHSMHSFMDTPSIHEHVQHEPFAQYGPREEVSPPEGASSSLSPPSSVFSTHSSPGYFPHELPHATGSRSDYAPPGGYYRGHNHAYSDGGGPAVHQVYQGQRANTWDTRTLPAPHPYHSHPQLHSSSTDPNDAASLFAAFGRPTAPGAPRRVPDMFKLSSSHMGGGMGGGAKQKQVMACLFCRARKIGCVRPPPEAANQTCNQCARRERECVYPTESRRGQHNRNRSRFRVVARKDSGAPCSGVPSPASSSSLGGADADADDTPGSHSQSSEAYP